MRTRLLTVAALLTSAVVGCDDPEVQDKVADVLVNGSAVAELECHLEDHNHPGDPNLTSPELLSYRANKLLDGSCFVEMCVSSYRNTGLGPRHKEVHCQSRLWPPSSIDSGVCTGVTYYDVRENLYSSTRPYRHGIDGTYAYVQDGILYATARDAWFLHTGANCGGVQCTDPQPWFSHDITTTGCTGRNLEAFGVTP